MSHSSDFFLFFFLSFFFFSSFLFLRRISSALILTLLCSFFLFVVNNTKSKKQKRRPSQSDRGSSLNAVMSSIGMGKSKVVVDLSRLSNVSREESKVSVVREDGEDEKLKDRLNGPPQRGISLAWSNKNGDEQQDDDVMSMRADDAV